MHAVLAGVAALFLAFLTPAVLLEPVEPDSVDPKILLVENEPQAAAEPNVRLQTGQIVKELPLDTYLTGVLISEMPMSFSLEALKAQAIAARTFAMRQIQGGKHSGFDLCDQSSCCQAWTGEEGVLRKLGDSWCDYWDKAAAAVAETSGQVLTYKGELIDAVYFSCSGGATEDAVAVWGGQVPYLQSVESPGEEEAAKYHTTVSYTRDDFCRIIKQAQPAVLLDSNEKNWIKSVSRTKGGGVAEINIGGCSFTGTEIRSLFDLNSTFFTLETGADSVVFSVYGYGHRVGMSQYGANAMANEGYSCQEILSHYYQGAEIRKMK